MADRLVGELALVGGDVELQPQVAAAERLDVARDRAEALLDRLAHRGEPLAVEGARPFGLRRVGAAREVAGERELVQGRRVDVVGALRGDDPVEHRAAGRDPAEPQAAPERLRERVDVDHVSRGLGAQRRSLLAGEAQVAVDAVLEQEEPVATGELQQPCPPRR